MLFSSFQIFGATPLRTRYTLFRQHQHLASPLDRSELSPDLAGVDLAGLEAAGIVGGFGGD